MKTATKDQICEEVRDQRALECIRAAGPELLAALKCFMGDARFRVTVGGNPRVVDRMLSDARAALAKAEGRNDP
jgi:hypothetical protein